MGDWGGLNVHSQPSATRGTGANVTDRPSDSNWQQWLCACGELRRQR